MKFDKRILNRAKQLDKSLSLSATNQIMMSTGEQMIVSRLNLLVSLMTLLLDDLGEKNG